MATGVIAAFLVILSVAAVTAAPPWEGGCTEPLISFSPCLSFVSSPPNNLTETASATCCDSFTAGVKSLCFCYLLRETRILGFPLNTTRILSLSSICPSNFTISLDLLCTVATALPPLNGTAAEPGSGGSSSGRMEPVPLPSSTSRGKGAPINLPSLNGSGSGSGSGGSSSGRMEPVPPPSSTSRGKGAPIYLPSLNGSGSTLSSHNSFIFLFSQILSNLFALTLINTALF